MYCENCGAKIPSGANFCEECGAKIDYADGLTEESTPKGGTSKSFGILEPDVFDNSDWKSKWLAAAQKASGQQQLYGVPPISPRQIAQQERAEEKKKMVKFALLSLAVFAVIVGAFTPFYSSEDKPQKPTGSEEVSNEPDSRDNNKTPQDDSWPGRSSKGAVVGAAQSQVTKNDTTAKTTPEVTTTKSPSSLQTGNGNNGGIPNKNAKDKPKETLGNKNNPVSTAGENEKPETPSAPGTTALKNV